MKKEITYLGKVLNVSSSSIEVEVSPDIPSSAPIIRGRVYKLGQIGTFIKIPMGSLVIYGIVSSVTNSPALNDSSHFEGSVGSRFLQVNLIGEKLGDLDFQRGVGTYPTINDEVHVVVEEDLHQIYGDKSEGLIEIGKHSSSDTLGVCVDLQKLVLRHSAILGSTGSGKSNTTAGILKNILNGYSGARIVLVDPHGEYASAFEKAANVFKIGCEVNPLYIPFWAMTFDELSFFLVGRQEGQEKPEDKELREKIVEMKKKSASLLSSGDIDESFITADSPIPFDIKQMWYEFDRKLNGTYEVADGNNQNKTTEELIDEGDPLNLVPAKFKPYSMGNIAPHKSKHQTMYSYCKKIHSRLKDSRYDFMFNPGVYSDSSGKDLNNLLSCWIGNKYRISILDLSGIPFELLDISVGLISRIIYDSMYWGRFLDYTGRSRPILLAYEEAHSYLPKNESSSHVYGYARKIVEKIFKEGRKFGVGALVITQRPSEISETILAQIGTFFALRLTNSSDQSTVKSAAPNNMNSLIELLSSLRIGEAIVIGESIKIPSRVRIELVEPRPSSNDPDLISSWQKEYSINDELYREVVTSMRTGKIKPIKEKK